MLASKRTASEALAWKAAWEDTLAEHNNLHRDEICARVIGRLGWNDEQVFMAEPTYVGYKRRKNLADLPMPNELYRENNEGTLATVDKDRPISVLDYYVAGSTVTPSSNLGFWTSLQKIASRKGLRLDPKYRWLWDYQGGVAHGDPSKAVPLSDLLEIVDLPKQPKGDLETDTQLIDLEYVESRQAIVREEVPIVGEIGSDKVRFTECELAIAKLEPYLGKVILSPPGVLGSTEWVGLRRKTDYPLLVTGYLLMLPDMCEAYRRLQSGKRHARLDPSELLDLKIELPNDFDIAKLTMEIKQRREKIFELRRTEQKVRTSIDSLFR